MFKIIATFYFDDKYKPTINISENYILSHVDSIEQPYFYFNNNTLTVEMITDNINNINDKIKNIVYKYISDIYINTINNTNKLKEI